MDQTHHLTSPSSETDSGLKDSAVDLDDKGFADDRRVAWIFDGDTVVE